MEIGIEKRSTLLKAREVIKENILLLSKYQKQVITAALNGEHIIVLLPAASGKLKMYQLLPFIVSSGNSPIRNKIPHRQFYCSAHQELYLWLGISDCKST